MNTMTQCAAASAVATVAACASAQTTGDVLWRYEIAADSLTNQPTVGDDGTIYASDTDGFLYAINPDGSERWTVDALRGQQGSADEGPVAVFADGTVVVGTNPLGSAVELVAYDSKGDFRWALSFDGPVSWFAGPTIGPDGHAYVAASAPTSDEQVMKIDADGTILWMERADPDLYEENPIGSEVMFMRDGSDDILVFHCDQNTRGQLFAFDASNGAQQFATPVSSVNAPFMQHLQLQVATDYEAGRAYMTAFGWGSAAWGMRAFNADGSVAWTYDPTIASEATAPVVGPDGTIFLGWDLQYLGAVEPDGTERWQIFDDLPIRAQPNVSPDGSTLAVVGSAFGQSGRVEVFDTANGASLWQTFFTLPVAGTVYPSTQPVFSPGGDAIYVGSTVFTGADVGSYIYAFAAADSAACPGDIADDFGTLGGDGQVSFGDFLALLGLVGPCPATPECPGDIADDFGTLNGGDGQVSFGDFLALLGLVGPCP